MTSVFAFVPLTALLLATVVLGAMGLGGGIYETALVDRAWPNNPAIIQPSRGGLNRGFIPKALWFEQVGDLTQEQYGIARRWIQFSRFRPALEAIAIISECTIVVHFGAAATH